MAEFRTAFCKIAIITGRTDKAEKDIETSWLS